MYMGELIPCFRSCALLDLPCTPLLQLLDNIFESIGSARISRCSFKGSECARPTPRKKQDTFDHFGISQTFGMVSVFGLFPSSLPYICSVTYCTLHITGLH